MTGTTTLGTGAANTTPLKVQGKAEVAGAVAANSATVASQLTTKTMIVTTSSTSELSAGRMLVMLVSALHWRASDLRTAAA